MEEKRSFAVPILAVLLLLLALSLYVGSYMATVNRVYYVTAVGDLEVTPDYTRLAGMPARWCFFPVYWLDRKVRPGYWNPEFECANEVVISDDGTVDRLP